MSQSARKMCAASPSETALLARAPRPGIPQRGQAAGGVVQSRAWTVTWTGEGCGVRKARIRSAIVPGRCVRSVPKRVERPRHRKRRKPSMTRADALGWRRTDLEKIARILLANLLQRSKRTFSQESFPNFLPSKKTCWIHKVWHWGVRQQYPPVLCALSGAAAARAAPWAGGRVCGILPREASAGSGRLRTRLPCHTLPGAARCPRVARWMAL
jgi:hypothetical protein